MTLPVGISTDLQDYPETNWTGRHSFPDESMLWHVLDPPGMTSLQIGFEGEDSQSELVQQVAERSRFLYVS